jgi:hypothetical protein
MSVPPLLAVIIRTATTSCYLAVQTASDIGSGTRYERRRHHDRTAVPLLLRRLVTMVGYYLGCAFDPRTFLPSDGDDKGRRRKDLDPAARRRRRALADLRRRHASMLLHALGDTAEAVEAALTRHWQIYGDEYPLELIEDYLVLRMRWRDNPVRHQIDVHAWACDISGVWVPTPAPVRHYLRRAREHEERLAVAYTPYPRRGVRPVAAPQPG